VINAPLRQGYFSGHQIVLPFQHFGVQYILCTDERIDLFIFSELLMQGENYQLSAIGDCHPSTINTFIPEQVLYIPKDQDTQQLFSMVRQSFGSSP